MQWNVLWLLQIKRYICLFIKLCQRTLKRKKYYAPNSKLLMNIFSHALQNRIINTIASFCAKIYSYICPLTLSVSGSSQFSLSFALGILFASWNRKCQISVHIFAPSRGYSLFISDLLENRRTADITIYGL